MPQSRLLPLPALFLLGLLSSPLPAQVLGGENVADCCFLRLEQPLFLTPDFPLGARAAGLAGAGAALDGDLATALHNPAALASLGGFEVAIGGDRSRGALVERGLSFDLDTVYRPFRPLVDPRGSTPARYSIVGQDQRSDQEGLRFAALAVPVELFGRRIVLSLSAQKLVDDPDLSRVRAFTFRERPGPHPGFLSGEDQVAGESIQSYRASTSGGADLVSVAAGLPLRLADSVELRIGLGLRYLDWSTRARSEESIFEEGVLNGEPFELSIARTRESALSFSDLGFEVGAQVDLGSRWTLGAAMRSEFATDYDQTETRTFDHSLLEFNDFNPALDPRTSTIDGSPFGPGRVEWPSSVAFGVTFRPTRQLLLTLEQEEIRWSKAEISGLAVASFGSLRASPKIAPRPVFLSDLGFPSMPPFFHRQRDASTLRFGAEYRLGRGGLAFPLRAGLSEADGPVSPYDGGSRASFDDEYPDLAGFALGIGLEHRGSRFGIEVDLAWSRHESEITLDPSPELGSRSLGVAVEHSVDRWVLSIGLRRSP